MLKRERIKRRIYPDRATARSDVFDYIEMFYNPKRRHGSNGGRSPVELERQGGAFRLVGVYETRGDSVGAGRAIGSFRFSTGTSGPT